MKRGLYVLCVVLVSSFFCSVTVAAGKPSCEDLVVMADDLDGVASAFASTGTIEEGSQLDRSIGKLVQALTMLANVENEPALSNSVSSMVNAYNRMDAEKFGLSLDSVITNLDRLYRRDCP